MLDRLFTNAVLVSHEGRVCANIGTKDGKVAFVGTETPEARETVDVGGKFVIPGCIDSHLHFQDPGYTDREDLDHGSAACAAGGVTTGISMPMNDPPIVDKESFEFTRRCYEGRSYVDYAIHGGITETNGDRMEELWTDTGATALKMFTCFSVADFPYVQDGTLLEAFRKMAKIGGVVMVHCENDAIIKTIEKELKDAGRNKGTDYVLSHPIVGENEAIQRVIYFAEVTGCETVILHVSNAAALDMIHAAKLRGVKVYAESAPHMFTFVQKDMERLGPWLKFSPVMHDEENREAMWDRIGKGFVDTIGSDHSPYTLEEKERGLENIWKAPNGIPGVETSLAVFLDGVNNGKLTLEQVVKMTSYNPAHIYGLFPRKGVLWAGSDADFVVLDMEKTKTYTEEDIKSKSKWSPYCGMTLKGWPVMTVVRGEVVYMNGEITGTKGYGQYVARPKEG